MPSISLYEKLLKQLGEKGLMQAARAEGVAAKSASEIPISVLEKISGKELSAAKDLGRSAQERLPSKAELDAIDLENSTNNMFSIESEPTTPGLNKMLLGMGAAGAAGTAGYQMMQKPKGPILDDSLEGGKVPGAPKSLKETVAQASKSKSETPDLEPVPEKIPGMSIPRVGSRPADYSAGEFSYDDSKYQETLNNLKNKEASAQQSYEKKRGINEWGEVAERVAQAAARFGAAQQGLKSGVDLSNIQMGKTDWGKKIDREAGDLERTQRSLGAERDLARDDYNVKRGAAERQFERGEAAKRESTAQRFREYEKQVEAQNRAKEKANELQIQEAKEKNRLADEEKKYQSRRQDELVDYEKKQKIQAENSPKESSEEKASAKKEEALAGLHAAYLSGDEKEIAKQRIAATKYLSPQQAKSVADAADSWFGGNKRAAAVLEAVLTGGGEAPPSAPAKAQDPKILDFAKQNGLSYDQAFKIIEKRKAGK